MRVIAILVLSACATSPPPPKGGPRGLRASEHLEAAHTHDQLAKHRFTGREEENGGPWVRHWDTGSEDEQAAAVHRSQAATLRAAYERACKGKDRTPAEAAISSLDRYGIGGSVTSSAVVFELDPRAGPPDRLLADLECHRAWMMLAPEGDDADPLDLPGLVIDAKGDLSGITVSIVARDPATVGELQRRAAHLLERRAPRVDLR